MTVLTTAELPAFLEQCAESPLPCPTRPVPFARVPAACNRRPPSDCSTTGSSGSKASSEVAVTTVRLRSFPGLKASLWLLGPSAASLYFKIPTPSSESSSTAMSCTGGLSFPGCSCSFTFFPPPPPLLSPEAFSFCIFFPTPTPNALAILICFGVRIALPCCFRSMPPHSNLELSPAYQPLETCRGSVSTRAASIFVYEAWVEYAFFCFNAWVEYSSFFCSCSAAAAAAAARSRSRMRPAFDCAFHFLMYCTEGAFTASEDRCS
mmetsp:Transcript_26247/g.66163  ORF Transcript_26247/g.66163 Transcript_26247/m.66163 type:complete len:264 (-) Transcript_26247:2666-3457(-)